MPQERHTIHQADQQAQSARPEQEASAKGAEEALQETDALGAVLDDIESVLESNAEEYVSSFVQKGGQ